MQSMTHRFDVTPFVLQDEGQHFDRKSLFQGPGLSSDRGGLESSRSSDRGGLGSSAPSDRGGQSCRGLRIGGSWTARAPMRGPRTSQCPRMSRTFWPAWDEGLAKRNSETPSFSLPPARLGDPTNWLNSWDSRMYPSSSAGTFLRWSVKEDSNEPTLTILAIQIRLIGRRWVNLKSQGGQFEHSPCV